MVAGGTGVNVRPETKDGFSLFHLGGCGQIMGGGCNLFPDNVLARRRFAPPHSREFFPDIGPIIASTFRNIIRLSKCE